MHLLTSIEALRLKDRIEGEGYHFATVILDKNKKLVDLTSTLELQHVKCVIDNLVNEQLTPTKKDRHNRDGSELEVLRDKPPVQTGCFGLGGDESDPPSIIERDDTEEPHLPTYRNFPTLTMDLIKYFE